MPLPQEGDLPDGARAKADAFGARLRGIAGDVEHGLDQLLAVTDDLGNARVVIALDLDGEFSLDEASHALEHLVNAERFEALRPVWRDHAVHQARQAIGFLYDDLRVFAQLRLVGRAFQQLRRASQPAQRILDLVGQIADQLAVRLLLENQA